MTFKTLIFSIIAAAILVGCSSGPQDVAKDEIQRATDTAKTTRALFVSVGGDFDKLSPEDKKKLAETYKNEAGAKKVFESMKNPPGGLGSAPMPPQAQGK